MYGYILRVHFDSIIFDRLIVQYLDTCNRLICNIFSIQFDRVYICIPSCFSIHIYHPINFMLNNLAI